MSSVATVKKGLGQRRRVALHHYSKRRRESHRAVPALFRTFRLPEGDTVSAGTTFSDENLEVTFAGRARRETSGAGTFLTAGSILSLGTDAAGGLVVRIGDITSSSVPVVAVGREFQFALSIRPNDQQVRLWVGSERHLAAKYGTQVLSWHDDGIIAFQDVASATMLDDLSIFYIQRPRHFGDANLILPDIAVEDILLRAARATFQIGHWPFMDEPNL